MPVRAALGPTSGSSPSRRSSVGRQAAAWRCSKCNGRSTAPHGSFFISVPAPPEEFSSTVRPIRPKRLFQHGVPTLGPSSHAVVSAAARGSDRIPRCCNDCWGARRFAARSTSLTSFSRIFLRSSTTGPPATSVATLDCGGVIPQKYGIASVPLRRQPFLLPHAWGRGLPMTDGTDRVPRPANPGT